MTGTPDCTPSPASYAMERTKCLQSAAAAPTFAVLAGLLPPALCRHHVLCRTEPLPSPFTKAADAAPAVGVGTAGGDVGPGLGTNDRQLLARSMEVERRPVLAEGKGPPTASQSLEPAASIPDRVTIAQRARRTTRVGKHGAARRVSMPCVPQSPAPANLAPAPRPAARADLPFPVAWHFMCLTSAPHSSVTSSEHVNHSKHRPRIAGWEAVRSAAEAAPRRAASRPLSGQTTPERAATTNIQPLASTVAPSGRMLRPSQSMVPQWLAGGRISSTAVNAAVNDRLQPGEVGRSHSVRSFSTAAEAVHLATVVREDPNEEAARARYLRLPGLQGTFLLVRLDGLALV